jgi:micrococcal nuclease
MYTYAAKLIRVIDGDTIEADIDLGFDMHYIAKVRLMGINAPEMRTVTGPASKEHLQKLLTGPLVITTTLNKEFEKYGRVLGTVIANNTVNVNQTMVLEGFAVAAKY